MSNFSKEKSINYIIFTLVIINILSSILINKYTTTVWFDEAYTLAMIKHSFTNIWQYTGIDVHPPLYYLLLKIFTQIFGSSLFTIRFFSELGALATLLIGTFSAKRYFGNNVALIFCLIFVFMPAMQYIENEARMYSWAMFFTFTASLSAYAIVYDKKLGFMQYTILLLASLAGAYTHNYSLMASCFILAFLCITLKIQHKKIRPLLIVIVLFIIGYSFWVPHLYFQIQSVANHYWISTPTLKDLLLFTYYFFSPKEPSHSYTIFSLPAMSIALSIMLLLLVTLIFRGIILYKDDKYKTALKKGIWIASIFLIPILVAIIITYTFKPILVPRYMICLLGPALFGFAILLSLLIKSGRLNKQLTILTLSVLIVFAVTRFFSEQKYQNRKTEKHQEIQNFFNSKIAQKTTFMAEFTSSSLLGQFELIYPDNLFLLYVSQRTNILYKPFNTIEVNRLPTDFDFYCIQEIQSTPIVDIANKKFLNSIQNDFIIVDSLIQKDLRILQMRTIHREREN